MSAPDTDTDIAKLDALLLAQQQQIVALNDAVDALRMGAILPVLTRRLGIGYDRARCQWTLMLPGEDGACRYAHLDAAIAEAALWIRANGVIDSSPADLTTQRVLTPNAGGQPRLAQEKP